MSRQRELIVDSFAGGGGASLGIYQALGRGPDIAINHDKEAIALHAANHPETFHVPRDVWSREADPVRLCGGRRVGLLWLSPDCKHFSKAKGAKPVSKKIRGLAWIAVRWAQAVRPRVIILENVEEFRTWGPVLHGTNTPCPRRKGKTYRVFKRKLEREGYVVEDREMRACDFGAPTTRKRLFLIARCDGEPIVWPEPTHGPGRALPWRTAAECIDFDLPCPSIFMSKEESQSFYRATGIRTQRPLEPPTMRRIARGVWRFVIDCPNPFIVPMQHENRPESLDSPLSVITTQGNKHTLVTPFMAPLTHAGDSRVHDLRTPHPTQTAANRGEHAVIAPYLVNAANSKSSGRAENNWPIEQPTRTQTGKPSFAVVTPFLAGVGGRMAQSAERGVTDPMQTATAKEDAVLVAPTLIQTGYGEDRKRNGGKGQRARALDIQQPIGTQVAGSSKHALVAAFMAQNNRANDGHPMEEPVSTIVQKGCTQAFTAVHLQRDFGRSVGADVGAPVPVITPGGGGKTALVTSHLSSFYTSNTRGGEGDPRKPLKTITAQGNHIAEVRAFLIAYYGTDQRTGNLRAPMPTITATDRFGLVTVQGQDYVIVDIGIRRLTVRERFRAQGFPDSYLIEIPFDYRVKRRRKGKVIRIIVRKPLTQEAQGRMVGNSVCPPHAAAIVAANCAWLAR